MSHLMEIIKAFVPSFKTQKDLDDAYLCESIDTFDLERRMRLLDVVSSKEARSWMFGTTMP